MVTLQFFLLSSYTIFNVDAYFIWSTDDQNSLFDHKVCSNFLFLMFNRDDVEFDAKIMIYWY